MARALKPVDDTPICDPDYLRAIDPVWTRGKVPAGFWKDRAHRRDSLLWLADKLGFRRAVDLYRLVFRKTRQFGGLRAIANWRQSPLLAVQDCFPEYDWKPWLFLQVARGFWDDPANRRSYFDWLGGELGFRRPEAWRLIQCEKIALRHGEGLLRGRSLCELMREYLPELAWDFLDVHRPLSIEEVLAWADAYHARHGKWPTQRSGGIPECGGTWIGINLGLKHGLRGLPGGTTLAKLLKEHRGVRVGKSPPALTEEQILAWADAHFAKHGRWPTRSSGAIFGTRESWQAVAQALRRGNRSLSGARRSLAQFLAERRGARNRSCIPPLTEEQILAWADAYFAAHGRWPNQQLGRIGGTDEVWERVDACLRRGNRGVGPSSSLALLLAERRGARHPGLLPSLTEEQILAWADAYFAAQGKWPNLNSGPIPGADKTWKFVDSTMRKGHRGLRRRVSLAQLLARRRGVKNPMDLPPLSEKQILAWADAYFRSHQKWPTQKSGRIAGTQENWQSISDALQRGRRGVGPDSSLGRLLARRRGVRNINDLPPLSEAKILAWAHRHFLAEGRWPKKESGPVARSPGDTWLTIDYALRSGRRGLPGGSSLAKLLHEHRLK